MQSLLRPRHQSLLKSVARNVTSAQASLTRIQQPAAAAKSPCSSTGGIAFRAFSSSAPEPAASSPDNNNSNSNYEWHHPKAQLLFEKITGVLQTEEEVRALQRHVYIILGRPLRENEFYHDGFGIKKSSGGGGGAAADEAKVEEKQTAFDIKLTGFDAKAKIKVIKEVRSMAGLGLKEAKELVESAPSIIQKSVSAEAAEEIKAKLVELGAEIELV